MMAWAGYLLTVLGFLAGAFLASLDPVEMQWRWFVPCLLIGSIGVFLVKRSSHASARSDETLANNRDHVEGSLDSILENLAVLDAGKADIPPYELRFEIDRRFRTDLNRFVAARESLVHIYGLQAYADIMSAFAAGERYLNRVWSASADGYVDEAREYIGRAREQFVDAKSRLAEAHRRSQG
ncbi:MAG: hypothetical protein OEU49_13280 [Chromatiales bacterium]|jgi:hypothetical protein|nr:hypothetical protein [Chromatiales bacterium]